MFKCVVSHFIIFIYKPSFFNNLKKRALDKMEGWGCCFIWENWVKAVMDAVLFRRGVAVCTAQFQRCRANFSCRR